MLLHLSRALYPSHLPCHRLLIFFIRICFFYPIPFYHCRRCCLLCVISFAGCNGCCFFFSLIFSLFLSQLHLALAFTTVDCWALHSQFIIRNYRWPSNARAFHNVQPAIELSVQCHRPFRRTIWGDWGLGAFARDARHRCCIWLTIHDGVTHTKCIYMKLYWAPNVAVFFFLFVFVVVVHFVRSCFSFRAVVTDAKSSSARE